MNRIHCHRCGQLMADGSLKYQVAVRVLSLFDGTVPDREGSEAKQDLASLVAEAAAYSEEELTRQVYEDDIFIMCPACKEAFLEDIYAHLHPKAAPEHGRAHLIH
jgi:hypothetical protein